MIVTRERIVRTIVGLRPFRPSGFVVRAEKLGDKIVVHNYGHGGCGVTLSWGTAALAVDEVLRTGDKRAAVLGCGAVGLATARLLQQRGIAATIYTREQPPATTSDVAGARLYPFDVFDKEAATPQFLATLWRAARVSYAAFRKLPARRYGIYRYPTYACRNTPFAAESLLNFDSPVHDLLPGLRDLGDDEKPFPYPIVRTFETMLIEPAVYLPAVMRDHARAGGRDRRAHVRDRRRRRRAEGAHDRQLHRPRQRGAVRRHRAAAHQGPAHDPAPAAGGRLRHAAARTSTCSRATTASSSAARSSAASPRSSPTARRRTESSPGTRSSSRRSPMRRRPRARLACT